MSSIVIASAWFLLLRIALAIRGLLSFPINFRTAFSNQIPASHHEQNQLKTNHNLRTGTMQLRKYSKTLVQGRTSYIRLLKHGQQKQNYTELSPQKLLHGKGSNIIFRKAKRMGRKMLAISLRINIQNFIRYSKDST